MNYSLDGSIELTHYITLFLWKVCSKFLIWEAKDSSSPIYDLNGEGPPASFYLNLFVGGV